MIFGKYFANINNLIIEFHDGFCVISASYDDNFFQFFELFLNSWQYSLKSLFFLGCFLLFTFGVCCKDQILYRSEKICLFSVHRMDFFWDILFQLFSQQVDFFKSFLEVNLTICQVFTKCVNPFFSVVSWPIIDRWNKIITVLSEVYSWFEDFLDFRLLRFY